MTMNSRHKFALALGAALALCGILIRETHAAGADRTPALQAVLDYVHSQKTTGFIVMQDGQVLAEQNWPVPFADIAFKTAFTYGSNETGELLEDVASQQKSFVAMLVAISVDKGLVDEARAVSDYIGTGWSKASPEQERRIRIIDILTMSSGLTAEFTYAAPAGSVFLYNTPVYAVLKQVLTFAAKQSLEALTQDWLTGPAGMKDTSWRKRPAVFGEVGNPTGLVTTPRDVAKFGQIIIARGHATDGAQIVSQTQLDAMFARSAANPAYGRLWWLNGSEYTIRALGKHAEGQLIPSAPPDLIAALGALDRKLYVSPARKLIVVRLGQAALDQNFDEHLWSLLAKALN